MPTYIMRNKVTGETSEFFGKWEDYKAHLAENSDLETVIGTPKLVSGVSNFKDAPGKIPDGFKDKLREIKKKHPGSSGVDHLI